MRFLSFLHFICSTIFLNVYYGVPSTMFSVQVIELWCIFFKMLKRFLIFLNSYDSSLYFLGVSDINSKNWANHENKTVNKITVVGGGELGIACTLAISAKVCKHSGYKYICHIATLLGSFYLTHKK